MADTGDYHRLSRGGDAAHTDETQTTFDETRSHEAGFLGVTEDAARSLAEKLNLQLRVIAPGDPITLDLRPRRMTVVIRDGVAVEAFAG